MVAFLAGAILWSALSEPCAVNFILARCGSEPASAWHRRNAGRRIVFAI